MTHSKTFHRLAIPKRLFLHTVSKMGLNILSIFNNLTFLHNAKRRNHFPLLRRGIPKIILQLLLFLDSSEGIVGKCFSKCTKQVYDFLSEMKHLI